MLKHLTEIDRIGTFAEAGHFVFLLQSMKYISWLIDDPDSSKRSIGLMTAIDNFIQSIPKMVEPIKQFTINNSTAKFYKINQKHFIKDEHPTIFTSSRDGGGGTLVISYSQYYREMNLVKMIKKAMRQNHNGQTNLPLGSNARTGHCLINQIVAIISRSFSIGNGTFID